MFERLARRYSFWTLFFAFVSVIFLSFAIPMAMVDFLRLPIDTTTLLLAVITAPISIVAFVIYTGVMAARHRLKLD